MRSSSKEPSGDPWVLRSGSVLVPLRTAFGVASEDMAGSSPWYRLSVIGGLWGHLQDVLQKREQVKWASLNARLRLLRSRGAL